MRLSPRALREDVAAMWRADRALLWPVAGMFLFLPSFAALLFLPTPGPAETLEEANRQLFAWIGDNIVWLALEQLVMLAGGGVVYALLLDPARPTLAEALRRAVSVLPQLAAATLLALLAMVTGLFFFVLPGAYVLGRTMLVGAVVVRERAGPAAAIARAVALTTGRGWLLFAIQAAVLLAGQLAVVLVSGLAPASAGGFAGALVDALSAGVAAATTLVMLLVKVATYRRLANSGT